MAGAQRPHGWSGGGLVLVAEHHKVIRVLSVNFVNVSQSRRNAPSAAATSPLHTEQRLRGYVRTALQRQLGMICTTVEQ